MELKVFEHARHINGYQHDFWKARELAKILEYSDYRNFLKVVDKAKTACINSGHDTKEHFVDITEPQKSRNQYGEVEGQTISDIVLSRYACYLIVQNADPSKEIVALGQSYFAIQTRKQEIQDQNLEDTKRVYLREEMKTHNKKLMSTAKEAGVHNYAGFNDAGYLGLYGLRSKQVQKVKGLNDADNLLDHIGSEELAANLFRATQTEAKIKREGVKGQEKADLTHFEVGKKVRKTIQDIGGTMPEKLPASDHIKEAKKRMGQQKKQKLR
ncbi:MAG: DNA damage-inducible protein D [candidate division SR1 bacterium]|nr:DNA damage-inducible protein D [candidate division SR1 bacterium]